MGSYPNYADQRSLALIVELIRNIVRKFTFDIVSVTEMCVIMMSKLSAVLTKFQFFRMHSNEMKMSILFLFFIAWGSGGACIHTSNG